MVGLRVQLQEPTDPALLAEQIKMFQVPYKILCKVVNVELKVCNHGRAGAAMFSLLHPSPSLAVLAQARTSS